MTRMCKPDVPINVENVKDGLDSFLTAAGVLRMDFPWGSIYWVGTIIQIDIRWTLVGKDE